jgi:hypothetical protein
MPVTTATSTRTPAAVGRNPAREAGTMCRIKARSSPFNPNRRPGRWGLSAPPLPPQVEVGEGVTVAVAPVPEAVEEVIVEVEDLVEAVVEDLVGAVADGKVCLRVSTKEPAILTENSEILSITRRRT